MGAGSSLSAHRDSKAQPVAHFCWRGINQRIISHTAAVASARTDQPLRPL